MEYDAIVIGASAGGLQALTAILPCLPGKISLPTLIVQHRASDSDESSIVRLNGLSSVHVKEAEFGESIRAGTVYIAPAGYHLHVESNRTLRLSVDAPVLYARPSIDVLFRSAADVYGKHLVGVVLTGANQDGAEGAKHIKQQGGLVVVQNPDTAQQLAMPRAAIKAVEPDHVLDLNELGQFLTLFCTPELEGIQTSRSTYHEQT